MNERLIRALGLVAKHNASCDTARYKGTLSAEFVYQNLTVALGGKPARADLVMDDDRIEQLLSPEGAYGVAQ